MNHLKVTMAFVKDKLTIFVTLRYPLSWNFIFLKKILEFLWLFFHQQSLQKYNFDIRLKIRHKCIWFDSFSFEKNDGVAKKWIDNHFLEFVFRSQFGWFYDIPGKTVPSVILWPSYYYRHKEGDVGWNCYLYHTKWSITYGLYGILYIWHGHYQIPILKCWNWKIIKVHLKWFIFYVPYNRC